jgi:putative endonuclease
MEGKVYGEGRKGVLTKKYNVDRLMFFEVFGDVKQAISREKQIKGWTRAKKDALIATMNPEWHDLSAEWFRER